MKLGNVLTDQVDSNGDIVLDYDQSYSPSDHFAVLQKCFPGLQKKDAYFLGEYGGYKFSIRVKNVTYLGIPHPIFKKRIQIASDLLGFYSEARSESRIPLLFGIYRYNENVLFVNFGLSNYINGKAHNSSAHVYSSDLSSAATDGFFQKIDFFGNEITVFKPEFVSVFFETVLAPRVQTDIPKATTDVHVDYLINTLNVPAVTETMPKPSDALHRFSRIEKAMRNTVFPKIEEFFNAEEIEWNGIDCYNKMIQADYRNKYQPEWAGFFLEFEFESFLKEHHLEGVICFAQDKTETGIDLDLYFPTVGVYGDLKAHSNESRGIQGNDWDTIFQLLDKNGHVYYIVCEHFTKKDSEYGNEVARYWNTVQKKKNLLSYAARMKHSVTLNKAYILDINDRNKEYLSMFRQGVNSDGKPRAPKIMIEQSNLKHFVVKEISLER